MQDIPYGHCQCGCGQKTEPCPQTIRSIGWRKGEPKRYINGHQSRKAGPKYRLDPETGCWVFLGYISKKGYGQMRPHGSSRMHPAHRVFYEEKHGPVPAGLQLDHLCRNRACVNPDHLEPVTNFENGRRGQRSKLTAEAVREIRQAPSEYGIVTALARKYNVHPHTVHSVRGGRAWNLLSD